MPYVSDQCFVTLCCPAATAMSVISCAAVVPCGVTACVTKCAGKAIEGLGKGLQYAGGGFEAATVSSCSSIDHHVSCVYAGVCGLKAQTPCGQTAAERMLRPSKLLSGERMVR